jgi:hypothetical protein
MRPTTRNTASLSLREIKGEDVKEEALPYLGNSPGVPKRKQLCRSTELLLAGEEIKSLAHGIKWHGLPGTTRRM